MNSNRNQKIMVQPISLIFQFMQSAARVRINFIEIKNFAMEGKIIGFDEYMNIVLDDAEEIMLKKGENNKLGKIMLKGDNISFIMKAPLEATA